MIWHFNSELPTIQNFASFRLFLILLFFYNIDAIQGTGTTHDRRLLNEVCNMNEDRI